VFEERQRDIVERYWLEEKRQVGVGMLSSGKHPIHRVMNSFMLEREVERYVGDDGNTYIVWDSKKVVNNE